MILAQEDKVCFYVIEEVKTTENKYGDTRNMWMKISKMQETSLVPTR